MIRSAGYKIYILFDFLGAKQIEVAKQLTMKCAEYLPPCDALENLMQAAVYINGLYKSFVRGLFLTL